MGSKPQKTVKVDLADLTGEPAQARAENAAELTELRNQIAELRVQIHVMGTKILQFEGDVADLKIATGMRR